MEKLFSLRLRSCFHKIDNVWDQIQEVRLRSGRPLILVMNSCEKMLDISGNLCDQNGQVLKVQFEDIQESLAYICQYSLYAFEDELRRGFITVRGGHRVGIAGQISLENGKIKSIAHVSSLNIRVAHAVKGCGLNVLPLLWEEKRPCHTLIVSPPGGGKTTLLRDLVRLFSDGTVDHPGISVGVVDERSEVTACYLGVPQNDVGIRTDVLDHCPKAMGIEMLVRSMAPKLIAFDELGDEKDVKAMHYAIHSGCSVLTTLHGDRTEDIRYRCGTLEFERYIFLNCGEKGQRICRVMNSEGKTLFKAG